MRASYQGRRRSRATRKTGQEGRAEGGIRQGAETSGADGVRTEHGDSCKYSILILEEPAGDPTNVGPLVSGDKHVETETEAMETETKESNRQRGPPSCIQQEG